MDVRGDIALARDLLLASALCLMVVLASCACPVADEPGAVASELVDAFVAADVDRAKAVTVPEQWPRIEEWMEGRQPFACRGGEWDTTGISGAGGHSSGTDEWNWGLTYQCTSDRTPYCLDVNDIIFRETADAWKVHDWGAVCEAAGFGYKCQEMCR